MGGVINSVTGGKNKYVANEAAYDPQVFGSLDNNMALQKMLMDQANGAGPNLGQQQFQNATQQLQNQAAGQVGSIKGISPAAQARLIAQQTAGIGQGLAGESALQRMQQQMLAQQQLGQNSLGTFDVASRNKLGMAQINAGVSAGNAANATATTGGLLGGAGAYLASGAGGGKGGGKAMGGVIEPQDGPQSELGRALAGMAAGGGVFMADGGVPGRAPVPGDSPANDLVPARLSPGEVVLPRTVSMAPDAPQQAASFVAALQQRQGGGYGQVANARAMCNGGRAYAEGGEVEEPGLVDRAKLWAERAKQAARDFSLNDAADSLPDLLGGKVRKQLGDRRARIESMTKGEE